MKNERVTRTWEFYRDNCQGFKEPMRQEFRRLDEYVFSIEAENEKLRELAKAAWGCVKRQVSCEDCRIVACGCTLATAMRECGIEVG